MSDVTYLINVQYVHPPIHFNLQMDQDVVFQIILGARLIPIASVAQVLSTAIDATLLECVLSVMLTKLVLDLKVAVHLANLGVQQLELDV